MAKRPGHPSISRSRVRQRAVANGFRSGYEQTVIESLKNRGVPYAYEPYRIKYEIFRTSTYTPDIVLNNKVIVEVKGHFDSADRTKMVRVKQQNPGLDIRFLFKYPNDKLYKGSKTTYAQWAERNGFPWAKGPIIPQEWITEAGL